MPGEVDFRRRILIVEDDRDDAECLRIVFEQRGHDVAVAPNGDAGIARAALWHPDVVLLDLGLPDIDGEQVAAAMKHGGIDPFIVAYTGHHDRRSAAFAGGCDAYVVKPDLDRIIALAEGIVVDRRPPHVPKGRADARRPN
jgi:two-component system, OmpR family, KDP operon response regulator KdpE